MNGSVQELEDRIHQLKAAQARANVQCTSCDGEGSFLDMTYDRCGVDTPCQKCFGTGFSAGRVSEIINDAFAPYRRARDCTDRTAVRSADLSHTLAVGEMRARAIKSAGDFFWSKYKNREGIVTSHTWQECQEAMERDLVLSTITNEKS